MDERLMNFQIIRTDNSDSWMDCGQAPEQLAL